MQQNRQEVIKNTGALKNSSKKEVKIFRRFKKMKYLWMIFWIND